MTKYSQVDINIALPKRPRHLDKIEDNDRILDIFIVADDGTKIHVRSDAHLLYMWRDEGDALRTVDPIVKYGSIVFQMEESPLLAWFLEESVRDKKDLKHFIVACANDVIDILSYCDLIIEVGPSP